MCVRTPAHTGKPAPRYTLPPLYPRHPHPPRGCRPTVVIVILGRLFLVLGNHGLPVLVHVAVLLRAQANNTPTHGVRQAGRARQGWQHTFGALGRVWVGEVGARGAPLGSQAQVRMRLLDLPSPAWQGARIMRACCLCTQEAVSAGTEDNQEQQLWRRWLMKPFGCGWWRRRRRNKNNNSELTGLCMCDFVMLMFLRWMFLARSVLRR